jgi:hypothetical protein
MRAKDIVKRFHAVIVCPAAGIRPHEASTRLAHGGRKVPYNGRMTEDGELRELLEPSLDEAQKTAAIAAFEAWEDEWRREREE